MSTDSRRDTSTDEVAAETNPEVRLFKKRRYSCGSGDFLRLVIDVASRSPNGRPAWKKLGSAATTTGDVEPVESET